MTGKQPQIKVQVTERRICPTCYELAQMTIVTRGLWEHWQCTSCGGKVQYKVK